MPEQATSVRARVSPDPRVVVIDDYAFTLTVRRGHVVVRSGKTERVISRLDAAKTRDGVARIIILSHVGSISVEVLRWAASLDVAVFQVSRDGTIGFCSPGLVSQDARMYKQQILAQPGMPNEVIGREITRELLTAKIAGQLEVLRSMGRDSQRITEYFAMMASARDIRSMLAVEGNAAMSYWKHWENRVFVPWQPEAMRYIPAHWNTFNGRASVTLADGYTASSNRNATDFVNACLNYAYKICETEAMYACYTLGLHPAIGMSHGAVHKDKPALALDIIEALRPVADLTVLSYLDYGRGIPLDESGKPVYLNKRCAYELEDGTCRLFPPMTTNLASTVSMAVAPHAMRWAAHIAKNLAATDHISVVAPFDPRLRERKNLPALDPSVTVTDLVPGHMWESVSPLIPAYSSNGKTADTRTVLAGILAHEIYGVPWPKIPAGLRVNWQTCRKRLVLWQETGVWDAIRAEVTRPGVSLHAAQ